MVSTSSSELESLVIGVLQEMSQDWDLDLPNGISSDTALAEDLAFESIDVVQLAVSLEQKLGREGLPFEKLFMKDGDYVDDLNVGQIVEFLARELK